MRDNYTLEALGFWVEDVSVQVDLNTLILMGESLASTGRCDYRGLAALRADRVELLDDDQKAILDPHTLSESFSCHVVVLLILIAEARQVGIHRLERKRYVSPITYSLPE